MAYVFQPQNRQVSRNYSFDAIAATSEDFDSLAEKEDRECLYEMSQDFERFFAFGQYKCVFRVASSDLNEVFRLTNLWDDPNRVKRTKVRGYSTSVGDIILLGDDFYIVESAGFRHLYKSE